MMDQKAVPLLLDIAILTQGGGHGLTFFPGIDKYQAFLSFGMLIDIADARICVFGRICCFFFKNRKGFGDFLSFRSLDILYIEMLHAKTPFCAFGIDLRDNGIPSGTQ